MHVHFIAADTHCRFVRAPFFLLLSSLCMVTDATLFLRSFVTDAYGTQVRIKY